MTTTVSAMRTENIRLIHEMTVPVKPKDLTDDEPSAPTSVIPFQVNAVRWL